MDNGAADRELWDSDEDMPSLGPCTTPATSSASWIPVGRGEARADLEAIVQQLKAAWAGRYAYRIDRSAEDGSADYQLFVRHL